MTLPTTDNSSRTTDYSSSNNQENPKINVKKKRNRKKAVNPEKKAEKNKKNQIRYLKETPEQRELRLQRQRAYKASRTPEQKEASRLKNALYTKRYRDEQLDLAETPEEREALLQKRKEYSRNYREKRKNLAKTPEQKEALRLKLVIEKRRSVAKLRQLPDRDCKGRLCSPAEIEARRLKRINDDEEINLLSLKKRWDATKKMREYRRKNQSLKTAVEPAAPSAAKLTRKKKEQIPSNIPIVVDEVNIEKAELQETTIQTVPSLQNANTVTSTEEEAFQDSFWPWYEPSIESFNTYETSESHLGYSRSFIFQDNILNNKNRSTKIERRKKSLETSLNCMRDLIEVKAKGDRFAVFGKYIAQKLTTSKRHEEEIRIAKILIDKVLEEWALGIQSSDTFCIN